LTENPSSDALAASVDRAQESGAVFLHAYDTADKIAGALEDAGLPVDSDYDKQGVGGPLIAPIATARCPPCPYACI